MLACCTCSQRRSQSAETARELEVYLHNSRPHLISTAELDIVLRAPYQSIFDRITSIACIHLRTEDPINTACNRTHHRPYRIQPWQTNQ